MNKSILNKGTKLLALAAGVVLFSTASYAQDLYNGATGKINNEGTIRVNDDNAIISNDQANTALIQNTGEIHIFGTDVDFVGAEALTSTSDLRIPGFVSYRAGSGTQNIHEGYYTDLDVQDASAKNFGSTGSDYFIGGNYTTAGGNRAYNSTNLTYDGTTRTQEVAAENGTNSSNTNAGGGYFNVAFDGAAIKNIDNGQTIAGNTTTILGTGAPQGGATGGVVVDNAANNSTSYTSNGVFTQENGAGDFTIQSASANPATVSLLADGNIIDATTQANAGGTLILGDGTNPLNTTINTNGILNLAADATAQLDVTGSAIMNVNGGFTNLFGARTNQTFAGTSTVDYQDGASNIVTTASLNPYGNFVISKSDANISPTNNGGTENDINVATSFAMNGGFDLNMDASTGGIVNLTSGTAGNVTYAGQEEVIGTFRRTHAMNATDDYVFGNAATHVGFSTAPSGGNYFEIYMDKDGSTSYYDPTRDVNRQVILGYDHTAWVGDVQVGYTQTDVTEASWNTGYAESQIRYLEGSTNATADERVATGSPYTRVVSAPSTFGTVSLPGMEYTAADVDGTADAGFFASNELILRAGPGVVASINPGRWSNPDTWDSGAEPLPFDSVLVRHNVWAGFVRPNNDNYTVDEATPGQMAASIQIIEPNATYEFPTLMIGHSDITAPFATNLDVPNGIEGRLTTGALGAYPEALPATLLNELPTTDASTEYRGGLIIFADGTAGQGGDMTISGEMVNNGCINVGGVLSLGQ